MDSNDGTELRSANLSLTDRTFERIEVDQPVEKVIPAYGRIFCSNSASLKLEEEAPRLHFSSLISIRISRPRLESTFWAGCEARFAWREPGLCSGVSGRDRPTGPFGSERGPPRDTSCHRASSFGLARLCPTARLCIAVSLVLFLTLSALPTTSAADLQATQRQRVHPVLIRKDHNALLGLEIESNQKSVFLESVTVSLEGTDDLGDVDRLEIVSTGQDGEFSASTRFGDALAPAKELTFRGHLRLRKGKNFLWLSCRLKSSASLSHRVDAACTSIQTTAGTITPTDQSPGVRKRIGVALRRHRDDGVHTYRIPALATTPKGTLLCVFDARRRRSKDLQEDIDIGLLRSTDRGQSWEPMRIIMDMGEYRNLPQEQNGCSDPGIVVDPSTGEVFVFAVWTWGRPGTHQWKDGGSEPGFEIDQTAQFLIVRSKDDGATWSEPKNLTREIKLEEWIVFAPSPQQGIAWTDGTLVMPVQGRDAKGIRFSTVMLSRDHGRNWTVQTPYAENNNECQAVQLGDGRLMLNCRSVAPTKFRTVAVSSDLGASWTAHSTSRKALVEPNCNGSLYRFDYERDGGARHVILFANPHSQTGRDHQSIQVSFDDGATWSDQHRLLLDAGRGKGYPSLSRVDDRHIGIVYEGSQAHLVFERIAIDELVGER